MRHDAGRLRPRPAGVEQQVRDVVALREPGERRRRRQPETHDGVDLAGEAAVTEDDVVRVDDMRCERRTAQVRGGLGEDGRAERGGERGDRGGQRRIGVVERSAT
ncbi:MAG: hypothetical protein KIT14_12925 [bacterium]|nr:hypothetical protein [bacterium]